MTQETKQESKQKPEKKSRRQEIIETYLALGSDVGFQTVSLSMIAEQVGMTKPSLFSHFKNFDEIKSSSCEFCKITLHHAFFNVDFKAPDAKTLLEELFQNFIDVFLEKPLIWWCAMLSQMESIDAEMGMFSESLNQMICARITVALDFCNQRSWTNIKDTDFLASMMTASIRREITKAQNELHDESDFDTLFSGLINLALNQ